MWLPILAYCLDLPMLPWVDTPAPIVREAVVWLGPGAVDGVEPDVGGAEPDDAKRVATIRSINSC